MNGWPKEKILAQLQAKARPWTTLLLIMLFKFRIMTLAKGLAELIIQGAVDPGTLRNSSVLGIPALNQGFYQCSWQSINYKIGLVKQF